MYAGLTALSWFTVQHVKTRWVVGWGTHSQSRMCPRSGDLDAAPLCPGLLRRLLGNGYLQHAILVLQAGGWCVCVV